MVSRVLRVALLLGLAAALLGAHLLFLRPWTSRWGASDEEVARALPGDELWPDATRVETRAVTISAPAREAWAWVRQIGQDRGGFYGYELLWNLARARIRDADGLLPDLPERAPGERLWLASPEEWGGTGFVVVARVDRGRALVTLNLVGGDEAPVGTWTFVVERLGPERSRLLVRSRTGRAGVSPPVARRLFDLLLFEPAHFVMERRMMLGLAERAERRLPPAWRDVAEVATWMAALAAFLASSVAALWRRAHPRPFLLFAAAGAALMLLPLLRPPLAASAAVALLLLAAIPWAFGGRRALGIDLGHVRMPRW
ncbi:MAG TPA: hypothetical protein VLS93_08930 [Anaeromyxobacteraceae bacterium]|nr:hypothetical protein [Anaeromyxobacteraceae bacterium]